MEPGSYTGKIKEYGLVTSPKGAPQVQVVFLLDGGKHFSWYGNLGSDKQQEYTTKILMTLGANANNIDKIENGISSGVLNTGKQFEIVIEQKMHNGKTYSQVKYINDPSAPRGKSPEFVKGTGALAVLKGQAAQLAAINGPSTKDDLPF